jgi:FMN-dependent NADH-azoreductase
VIKSRERNQETSSSFTEVKQKLADSIQACTADFLYLENLFIFVFPIYVFSVFKKSLSFFDHIIFSATSSFLKFLSLVVLVASLRDKERKKLQVFHHFTQP